MEIVDIYTKTQYECSKCNAKVFYGKAYDELNRKYITKDGKDNNGKYGKESNVVSVQVDVLDGKIHPCSKTFIDNALSDALKYSNPKSAEVSPAKTSDVVWSDIIKVKDFTPLQSKIYHKYQELNDLAYFLTKRQHPNEPDDTSLFGMIVSAKLQVLSNILVADCSK